MVYNSHCASGLSAVVYRKYDDEVLSLQPMKQQLSMVIKELSMLSHGVNSIISGRNPPLYCIIYHYYYCSSSNY